MAKLNPFTVNTPALFFLIWKPNLALLETKKLFTHQPSTKHHGAKAKRMGVKKCKEIFPQCGKGRSSTQLFYYRSCTSWCNCTLDENKGEEQHHFGTLWIAKLYGYETSFEVILVSHEKKSKLWFLYKRPPTICMYIVNIHRSHGW